MSKLYFARCPLVLKRLMSAAATSAVEAGSLDQKEIRERALADAMAREEEAKAKEKLIREKRVAMKELIHGLNVIPSHLAKQRSAKLQQELADIRASKQLDEELEELLTSHLNLPNSEISKRSWISPKQHPSNLLNDPLLSQKTKSTTGSFTAEFPNLRPTPDYKPYSENELFLRQLAHTRASGGLGSKIRDAYFPSKDVKAPSAAHDVSIKDLLAAGCHLGHSKSLWRPSTQPFIFGEYDGVLLIDLNETVAFLNRAAGVMTGIAKKGGVILYVGTSKKTEQRLALEEAAKRSNGYYVSKRWIPGTITNFLEVTKQLDGEFEKEVDLGDNWSGKSLPKKEVVKPDIVVIMNPVENRNLINECIKSRIPTIGLCDTNMEPSLLTYPIPCNDDSTRACSVILGALSKAAEDGMKERTTMFQAYKASS